MRKLATIRRIADISPIENADAIEVSTVDGWQVVVKKGDFQVGELAVYLEVDSFVPVEIAPFLVKGKEPRVFNGVQGEKLRTIRLRGQISQGLLLPTSIIEGDIEEGQDVTEALGIQKWELPVSTGMAGSPKGSFPSFLIKTDQERIQNIKRELTNYLAKNPYSTFEVTEKCEGSSMTCYLKDGEFGVCSRSIDLKPEATNTFWEAALRLEIEGRMRNLGIDNIAIQGELIGPKIQGNIYGLEQTSYQVFDIFDINNYCYQGPIGTRVITDLLGLEHVPVVEKAAKLDLSDLQEFITQADGNSLLPVTSVNREGLVYKLNSDTTRLSFKVISNKYLLNQK